MTIKAPYGEKSLDIFKSTSFEWTDKIEPESGIQLSYEDFLNNHKKAER